MNDRDLFIYWLTRGVVQLPVLLVSLAACLVVLLKWKQGPACSVWALLGFGLALLLCLLVPTGETFAQRWLIESHDTAAQVGWAMTRVSFLWSFLHAVTYALLLGAVYVGRRTPPPAFPPPSSVQKNL